MDNLSIGARLRHDLPQRLSRLLTRYLKIRHDDSNVKNISSFKVIPALHDYKQRLDQPR